MRNTAQQHRRRHRLRFALAGGLVGVLLALLSLPASAADGTVVGTSQKHGGYIIADMDRKPYLRANVVWGEVEVRAEHRAQVDYLLCTAFLQRGVQKKVRINRPWPLLDSWKTVIVPTRIGLADTHEAYRQGAKPVTRLAILVPHAIVHPHRNLYRIGTTCKVESELGGDVSGTTFQSKWTVIKGPGDDDIRF